MPKKGFSVLTLKKSAMDKLAKLAKKLDINLQEALELAVDAYQPEQEISDAET